MRLIKSGVLHVFSSLVLALTAAAAPSAESVVTITNVDHTVVATGGLKPGDTNLNTVGMTLVYIPPGEFMMGSTQAERDWAGGPEGQGKGPRFFKNEKEPRLTHIKAGFWMGRTEVTVGQFRQFVDETGYQTDAEKSGAAFTWATNKWAEVKGANWRDPHYGFAVKDDHPVACVS